MTAALSSPAAPSFAPALPLRDAFAEAPSAGTWQKIADDLWWLKIALPYAGLDHVNVWILKDEDGFTAIDAGLYDAETCALWEKVIKEVIGTAPLRRMLVTHFHPDHMGGAAWLSEKTGAEFLATAQEIERARWWCLDAEFSFRKDAEAFFKRCGLPPAMRNQQLDRGNVYRTRVKQPPAVYTRLQQGQRINLASTEWVVLIGRGHAPEHISLYSPERRWLLAGDQVLPKITPNVPLLAVAPDDDPLGDYLASFAQFRVLPEDTLVLPSHGKPFYGLHARMDAITAHHEKRLAKVFEACRTAQTGGAMIPILFEKAMDEQQMFFAIGETLSHLVYLTRRGWLSREVNAEGEWLFRQA